MDDRELEQALLERTRFRRLVHVAECGSTQDLAASDPGSDPAAFWADHQAHGRGREGREWHDEPGADLTVTFRLTGLRIRNPVALPVVASLAVVLAVEGRARRKVRLSWPNDVLLDGRKLAGVLIDGRGDGSDTYLLGVGINVNRIRFPRDLEHVATSLALATGHATDRHELLSELAGRLHECLSELQAGSVAPLEGSFRERLVGMDRPVVVTARGEEHRGRLVGFGFEQLVLDGGRSFPLGLVRRIDPR